MNETNFNRLKELLNRNDTLDKLKDLAWESQSDELLGMLDELEIPLDVREQAENLLNNSNSYEDLIEEYQKRKHRLVVQLKDLDPGNELDIETSLEIVKDIRELEEAIKYLQEQ